MFTVTHWPLNHPLQLVRIHVPCSIDCDVISLKGEGQICRHKTFAGERDLSSNTKIISTANCYEIEITPEALLTAFISELVA